LTTSGFRFTPQRQHVYDVIMHKRDHPTADEVFVRAKKSMPEISHATVYNTLDALVKCGLVRQVQLQRGATRFCPNMEDHCHYYCDTCSEVFDVPLQKDSTVMPRPKGSSGSLRHRRSRPLRRLRQEKVTMRQLTI